MAAESGTKQKAIKVAQTLLQKFGFNGFSFQHVADALSIRKPSLYAHFLSKEALGIDLVEYYRQTFTAWADTMNGAAPEVRLGSIYDLFYKFAQQGGLYCPLAALNAEVHTLPPGLKRKLRSMHDLQFRWLRAAVIEGQDAQVFRSDRSADELTEFVMALGIGAQFASRMAGDPDRIKLLKNQALAYLCGN